MDTAPQKLSIGAINPYALTEAITGRKFDWSKPESIRAIEIALETSYSELFDMKYNSPIYAGLKLNTATNMAEPLPPSEIKVRQTEDIKVPDLSRIEKLEDLKSLGIKDLKNLEVTSGNLNNGKLELNLRVPELDTTISKTVITPRMKEILFSGGVGAGDFTPAGGAWKDIGDFYKDVVEYNDPVQGAVANCYFIAAMAAVAWADPYCVAHKVRATGTGETQRVNAIQFYSKGGGKDAPSKLVEVTDNIVTGSANSNPFYCRSNDASEIWPALYEKAFAKWITLSSSDKPDITQTAYGDPAKATAQLNNKTPYYYNTSSNTGDQLYDIVRGNSMSYKTIYPMTAWTYGSNVNYSGTNVVGNHAYTILGWAFQNNKKYIVLRNPWGVTEPAGLNTYQGLLSFFDASFWRPITMIGNDGVFALEAGAFKNLFATIGVAK